MSWSISILQYLNESIHFYHKKCSVYSLYSTQCVDSCNSIRGFPMKCLLRNLLRCLPLVSALLSRQMKSVLNRQICFHLGNMHFSISIICFDRFFNGKFYRYTRNSDDDKLWEVSSANEISLLKETEYLLLSWIGSIVSTSEIRRNDNCNACPYTPSFSARGGEGSNWDFLP